MMEKPPKAPEGGWGWMVVLGSCISHLLMGAVVRSMGVIYLLLQERYDTSATMTSWFTAVPLLLWTGLGPLTTALCDRFSCRLVTVLGGLFLSLGLVSAAFVDNIALVFLTFGILTGTGLCFIYVPGYLIVGDYFDKKKGVAMALSTVGSGIGAFLFPFLIQMMYDYYGYQGCFVILGAITLNGCVGGALSRPLVQKQRQVARRSGVTGSGTCSKRPKDNDASKIGNCGQMQICTGPICRKDGYVSSNDNCDQPCEKLNSQQLLNGGHKLDKTIKDVDIISLSKSKCVESNGKKSEDKINSQTRSRHPSWSLENILVVVNNDPNPQVTCINGVVDTAGMTNNITCSFKRTWRSENEIEHMNNNISPFKDFNGDMVSSLQKLSGSKNNSAYVLLQGEETESRCCNERSKSQTSRKNKKTRRKLFNWELLKLPSFLVICLLGITANATFAITVNFLPALAVDMGLTRDQGAFLLSLLGIGDMVGRLPVGVLFDLPLVKTHRNMIYGLFMTVNGFMTFVMPLSNNYSILGTVCLVRGLSSGVFMSQRATILADMIGISRVASAFGMQLLFMTLGSLAARMAGGMLKDWLGAYDHVFYSTGAILVISTVVYCGYIYCDNRRSPENVSEIRVG